MTLLSDNTGVSKVSAPAAKEILGGCKPFPNLWSCSLVVLPRIQTSDARRSRHEKPNRSGLWGLEVVGNGGMCFPL